MNSNKTKHGEWSRKMPVVCLWSPQVYTCMCMCTHSHVQTHEHTHTYTCKEQAFPTRMTSSKCFISMTLILAFHPCCWERWHVYLSHTDWHGQALHSEPSGLGAMAFIGWPFPLGAGVLLANRSGVDLIWLTLFPVLPLSCATWRAHTTTLAPKATNLFFVIILFPVCSVQMWEDENHTCHCTLCQLLLCTSPALRPSGVVS